MGTAANCDVAGCPKWRDLEDDPRFGGGFCVQIGCEGGQYFVGRNSFMKNMALPVGHVNLRFTCCTYLAFTKTTPKYCDDYDFGDGLLSYCQRDYQGYGGPNAYTYNRRRLMDETSTSNIKDHQFVKNPVILEINLSLRQIQYVENTNKLGLYPNHQIQGDYEDLESAMEHGENAVHQVNILFESGETKEFFYKEKLSGIKVPPLDLFDETLRDQTPPKFSKSRTKVK